MLTVIVFIIILGFLVFVHELGHFLVARAHGIKAEEFGFGFPPRAVGVLKDEQSGKWQIIRGNQEVESSNTLYSLNWIPIGGFVRIKGENGDDKKATDSFASKSAWQRVQVLAAGVAMNFVFAWILFSVGFMLGTPQQVDDLNVPGAQIMIDQIEVGAPAEQMGLKAGDVISRNQKTENGETVKFNSVTDLQNFIASHGAQPLALNVLRGQEKLTLTGTPVVNAEGKARLGISLAQVATVKYGFGAAFREGFFEMGNVFLMIAAVFQKLFVGEKTGLDVTGVVGIAIYTGQVIPLGIAHILRFAAILSINLGIINALPFPALDGGRVLFILIEKIKGSPVSQKVEGFFHTAGFVLLMLLMVVVTWHDFVKFDIVDKIKGLF